MIAKNIFQKISKKGARINLVFFFVLAVLAIGYFTYFNRYSTPASLFWDENYHITSAEKYISGVMFMEPHPPLGKLFISLGEVILDPNSNIDKGVFLETDYIKELPKGFSFTGVRLFPTLFSVFSALFFFGILFQIVRNALFSFIFTGLYLFDNAIIVHSRSAMLEGTQLFFVLAALWYCVYLLKSRKDVTKMQCLFLGAVCGLAIAVKINSCILLGLIAFILLDHYFKLSEIKTKKIILDAAARTFVFLFGVCAVFMTVFYIHFALGNKVAANHTYEASPAYMKILEQHANRNPLNFPVMLRDNFRYIVKYQNGVPRLNRTSPDENGSSPAEWVVGSKTINYRWDKYPDNKVSYKYLMGNPVIWLSGLIGIILAGVLLLGKFIYNLEIKNKELFGYIAGFSFLYAAYMISVLQVDRVLYLYHYFVPLLMSLILFALSLYYIYETEIKNRDRVTYISFILFMLIVFGVYMYFSPFTYYARLTAGEFMNRIWFDFWGLHYVR